MQGAGADPVCRPATYHSGQVESHDMGHMGQADAAGSRMGELCMGKFRVVGREVWESKSEGRGLTPLCERPCAHGPHGNHICVRCAAACTCGRAHGIRVLDDWVLVNP